VCGDGVAIRLEAYEGQKEGASLSATTGGTEVGFVVVVGDDGVVCCVRAAVMKGTS
jgi:hypothetical protein